MVNCRSWKELFDKLYCTRIRYWTRLLPLIIQTWTSMSEHPLPQAFRWHYKPRLTNPAAITLLNDKEQECRIKAVDTGKRLATPTITPTYFVNFVIEMLEY